MELFFSFLKRLPRIATVGGDDEEEGGDVTNGY